MTDKPDLGYEQARDELVEIVRKLESGSVPLSESMTLWERGEELARIELVHGHQPRERRAELPVVGLLQMPRVDVGNAEIMRDELAHAVVHLCEQVAFRRIERVVEIEDPDIGVRE